MRLFTGRRSRKNPTIELGASHQAGLLADRQLKIGRHSEPSATMYHVLTSSDHAVDQQLA